MSVNVRNIQIALNVARQADLEQGCAWLDKMSEEELAERYPNLNQVINNILEMEVEDETV